MRQAVARIALTGRIGKPLISLQGTYDVLLPISRTGDTYARMVEAAGRDGLFRYYRVAGGSHVDGLFDTFADRLRPLTPGHRSACRALESWLDGGPRPPAGHTVPMPRHADPERLVTDCPLTPG